MVFIVRGKFGTPTNYEFANEQPTDTWRGSLKFTITQIEMPLVVIVFKQIQKTHKLFPL